MTYYPLMIDDYKIAAAHNNAAGLVLVQSILPAGDTEYFCAPQSVPSFSPGIRKMRLDEYDYIAGKKGVVWVFSLLTWYQYAYLSTTYCAGGYSGQVTIRTRTGRHAFANFNATLHLPFPSEMRAIDFQEFWEDVPVNMSGLVAL